MDYKVYKNKKQWLKNRKMIGGSDAGAIIGVNPYKTNQQLYREKTGELVVEDISDNPAVKYGVRAEEPIRTLFQLDYPQYKVEHDDFGIYTNSKYPYCHASIDGKLIDRDSGEIGILEIKTTTIRRSSQWDEWTDKIPDMYYVQLLHYLMITDFDFAYLRGYIKYFNKDGKMQATVRDYMLTNDEFVKQDIVYLADKEKEFIKSVKARKEPDLILPTL